ncbi:hypothetical protein HU200_015556 [Digitaria exilis]|uniref:Uncharacterized protein n=1 Tax=Digitaria exilis TaxID=1010633 RepID=A0A835KJS8_9POAL|nr:hypothetical protein HU200_015556 [Digitaria exilis]
MFFLDGPRSREDLAAPPPNPSLTGRRRYRCHPPCCSFEGTSFLSSAPPRRSPPSSPVYHRACLLFNSKSTSVAAPFSLEDYLVAACGLAPAQARKTAKRAFDESSKDSKKAFEDLPSSRSRLHSACTPDAVLALLSGVGLSRADIAAVVTVDPLLLRSSPKNMCDTLLALRDRHGLSAPQIVRFLLVGSRVLRSCDIGRTLEFFTPPFSAHLNKSSCS